MKPVILTDRRKTVPPNRLTIMVYFPRIGTAAIKGEVILINESIPKMIVKSSDPIKVFAADGLQEVFKIPPTARVEYIPARHNAKQKRARIPNLRLGGSKITWDELPDKFKEAIKEKMGG